MRISDWSSDVCSSDRGLVVARIAYIVFHWEAYAVDPLTTLAFWQGGFTAWAGLLAAAAILAWRMRPMRAMHKALGALAAVSAIRSEEHTSELQSLMRISYAVFCLKKKKPNKHVFIISQLKYQPP